MPEIVPDFYTTLRTVLTSSDPAKITSKWVADQVIAEEYRRISQHGGSATAFYANAKRGKSAQGNSDVKCSHCKKKGHKKADCRKLKREKEEREAASRANATAGPGTSSGSSSSRPSNSTSSSNATAKIAVTSGSPPPYGAASDADIVRLFLAVAVPHQSPPVERPSTRREHHLRVQVGPGSENSEDRWIMDSGASRIMSGRRDWFHHFSPLVSPINIVLGDESAIQATGVGHISVRMHAEGTSTPTVLQDVLFVLELPQW